MIDRRPKLNVGVEAVVDEPAAPDDNDADHEGSAR